MIKYKKGCLIKAFKEGEVNVIAHCCNCFNTMGTGVAKSIAKAFPQAVEADNRTVKGDKHKLGSLTRAITSYGSIFNLYGQYRYSARVQQLDYEALNYALLRMALELYPNGVKIGLPKIGCGLAGGDWEVVEGIISVTLEGFDVTVYEL